MTKTEGEIQERIGSRKARVYTAAEFKEMIRGGAHPTVDDVDVVTCGTMGVMSGTMAVLSIPVAGPAEFKRADTITLNGVPGNVGPCPNESLGIVDCVVYGTARRDAGYGGGHLFRDMVAGEPIDVRVTSEGREFGRTVTLSEIPFARMILTRGAFRNYTCFVNGSDEPFHTIFSGPGPLAGGCSEASVSGCGEINPIQNDPGLDYLRPGSTVLLNGAPGMIIGTGTRSTPAKPNLSIAADMHLMRADYMGGFRTSEGPECMTSVATAIPVTDERALEGVSVLDEQVELPLADVRDRVPVHKDTYASVWSGSREIEADMSRCVGCEECAADASCPADAKPSGGIDRGRCVRCGLCTETCVGGAFSADLGSVDYGGKMVPIAVRQSSRYKGERLCEEVKALVEQGSWELRYRDGRLRSDMCRGRRGRRGEVHAHMPGGPQGPPEDEVQGGEADREGHAGDVQVLRLAPGTLRAGDRGRADSVQERGALEGARPGRPVGRVHRVPPGQGRQGDVLHLQGAGGAPDLRPPEGLRRGHRDSGVRRQHGQGLRPDRQRHREPLRRGGAGGGPRPRPRHRGPGVRQGPRREGGLRRRDRRGRQAGGAEGLRLRGRGQERGPQGRHGHGDARGGRDHGKAARPLLPGRRQRDRRHRRLGGLHAPDRGREVRGPPAEAGAGPEPAVHPHGEGVEGRPQGDHRRGPGRPEGGRGEGVRGRAHQQEAPVRGEGRGVRRHDRLRRRIPGGHQRRGRVGREALDLHRGGPPRPGGVRRTGQPDQGRRGRRGP